MSLSIKTCSNKTEKSFSLIGCAKSDNLLYNCSASTMIAAASTIPTTIRNYEKLKSYKITTTTKITG